VDVADEVADKFKRGFTRPRQERQATNPTNRVPPKHTAAPAVSSWRVRVAVIFSPFLTERDQRGVLRKME
jgi:hypothetical protein